MNVRRLRNFCRRLPGAVENPRPPPTNILGYTVGGKYFAWFKTSEPERWRFSLRVTPDRFLELTDMPGCKPARFMARYHWVTIVDVSRMPEAYLRELVEWSYRRALGGLSGKKRRELLGEAAPSRDPA
ncbi:MmcQ/YjbR family DNA-binding protein [Luteimonas aquatica]|uniref:MmcQ/YjbR family DNA-binding protein n=1 Tax=Luteimonas aquatica TaxID=450364 RepID=UPI0024124DC7|nr:MmcQ/YjbR family DNA-binding protein [Luteimonas aquatica]